MSRSQRNLNIIRTQSTQIRVILFNRKSTSKNPHK